jgi:hypothetical protein
MRKTATITAVLGVILLAGCQKALFPEGTPRTQFETYDRARTGYVPLEEPDIFGKPQPALRSRLQQPD